MNSFLLTIIMKFNFLANKSIHLLSLVKKVLNTVTLKPPDEFAQI